MATFLTMSHRKLMKWVDFGHPWAKIDYGYRLAFGKKTKHAEDFAQAFKLWKTAAIIGVSEAQFLTGLCYEHGLGVAQNRYRALNWYKKAAWQGDPEAAYFTGLAHLRAAGYPPDRADQPNRPMAYYWLNEAVCLGNADALVDMGDYWLTGDEYNDPSAIARVHWYEKAARRKVPRALESLARCYETGTGVNQDGAKARKLLKKADRLRQRQKKTIPSAFSELTIKDDDFGAIVRTAACALKTM